jgi:hypothetical protein
VQGKKPGLVVRAEDSRPRGHGFESRRILDGCKRFASYYKEKFKIKVAKWDTPKKYLKKTGIVCACVPACKRATMPPHDNATPRLSAQPNAQPNARPNPQPNDELTHRKSEGKSV